MELEDCLFPLLREVSIGIDPRKVGARENVPEKKGIFTGPAVTICSSRAQGAAPARASEEGRQMPWARAGGTGRL